MNIRMVIGGFLAALSAISCGGGEPGVQRIRENGIEIVLNPKAPVRRGGSARLRLEQVRSINLGGEELARAGLVDILAFDIGPDGGIFVLGPPIGKGPIVHRLSLEGKIVSSFGSVGQGPNEIQYPSDLRVVGPDRVYIAESPNKRIDVFDLEGHPVEVIKPIEAENILPLPKGGFLIDRLDAADLSKPYLTEVIDVCDSKFGSGRELDRFDKIANRSVYEKVPEPYVNGIGQVFTGQRCGDRIVIGNSARGYALRFFDQDGRAVQEVRKEYDAVPVAEQERAAILKDFLAYMPDYAKKIYFPASWHPYQSFFGDDEGWLFVVTYEPGAKPRERTVDIFDRDGVLAERISLEAVQMGPGRVLATARGGFLYAVQERDDGFKAITIYSVKKR